MESSYLIDFYKDLEELDILIWIDGGWCVDALLGKQTRNHKDLDIVVQKKHLEKFNNFLKEKNYREIKIEERRPHNFVVADDQGHEIDVHVIVIDDNGNGIYGPKEKGEMYPVDSLTGEGLVNNVKVRCITAEWMVKFHSGYELKEKDFRDVTLLCEKFGIALPEEYKKFKNQ